jgi:hypothetical protein
MGNTFWHPTKELMRLPGGWKVLRDDGLEGGILREGLQFEVFIRRHDQAVYVGAEASLANAAWRFWKWGRENRWP